MIGRVILWLLAAIVIFGAICFLVLDAMDKVESIKKRVPWIDKILDKRSTFVALLMVSIVLLVGNAYELVIKELPEVSPLQVTFRNVAPNVTCEPAKAGTAAQSTQADQNRKNRLKVAMMLQEGDAIKRRCDSLTSVPGIFMQAAVWASKTSNDLAKIDPSYKVRFDGAEALTYMRSIGNQSLPEANNTTWNYINARTEVLTRILETMPN